MTNHHELADTLRAWINQKDNYSIVHFAINMDMSKEKLFKMADENTYLNDAVQYALSVMEYKLSEGALKSVVDRQTALKMLETYNGWKGELNIIQKNEYIAQRDSAVERANRIIEVAPDYPPNDSDFDYPQTEDIDD